MTLREWLQLTSAIIVGVFVAEFAFEAVLMVTLLWGGVK